MLDIANDIVAREISLCGVVGRKIFETWNQSINFLSNPSILQDLSTLVTHKLMFEDFEQGFDLMLTRQCGKVLLFLNADELRESQ